MYIDENVVEGNNVIVGIEEEIVEEILYIFLEEIVEEVLDVFLELVVEVIFLFVLNSLSLWFFCRCFCLLG